METARDKTTNLIRPAAIQQKGRTKFKLWSNLVRASIAISTKGREYPNTQYGLRKRENTLPRKTPDRATRTTPAVSSQGFICTPSNS
ncbi:MAG: hypothetical protein ACYSYM_07260 [Planctomycetota bacterium]|jgi:hypothetical protein